MSQLALTATTASQTTLGGQTSIEHITTDYLSLIKGLTHEFLSLIASNVLQSRLRL